MRLDAAPACAALALVALLPARPVASAPFAGLRTFDSPAEALASIPLANARVIAFGEYHEIEGRSLVNGVKVRSSIARFTEELLPMVAPPLAANLVLETWVKQGSCGEEEEKVVEQVQETTRRPETTESELVQLIKRSRKVGVFPHILTVTCEQYAELLDENGEMDTVKLLLRITRLLEEKITSILKEEGPTADKAVLVYGGALHNDVHPQRELRPFTFAVPLRRATRNRYLEIDLYVPEFVEQDASITGEAWFRRYRRVPAGKTALVRRSANSYILVFPRTSSPPPPPAAAPAATPPG